MSLSKLGYTGPTDNSVLTGLQPISGKRNFSAIRFGGLNKTQRAGAGELVDCTNLSSRNFPCLSPREGRGEIQPSRLMYNFSVRKTNIGLPTPFPNDTSYSVDGETFYPVPDEPVHHVVDEGSYIYFILNGVKHSQLMVGSLDLNLTQDEFEQSVSRSSDYVTWSCTSSRDFALINRTNKRIEYYVVYNGVQNDPVYIDPGKIAYEYGSTASGNVRSVYARVEGTTDYFDCSTYKAVEWSGTDDNIMRYTESNTTHSVGCSLVFNMSYNPIQVRYPRTAINGNYVETTLAPGESIRIYHYNDYISYKTIYDSAFVDVSVSYNRMYTTLLTPVTNADYNWRRDWSEDTIEVPLNADSFFVWDDKPVWTTEGYLYYNRKKIANVAAGEKQFAVVNSKLVVWPDKLYIDLTDENEKTVHSLDVQVELDSAQFSNGTITGTPKGFQELRLQLQTAGTNWTSQSYQNSQILLAKEITFSEDGTPSLVDPQFYWTRNIYKNSSDYIGYYFIPGGSETSGYTYRYVTGWTGDLTYYGTTPNTENVYGQISKIILDPSGTDGVDHMEFYAQLIKSGQDANFRTMFKVGDVIDMECDLPNYNTSVKVTDLTAKSITTNGSFHDIIAFRKVSNKFESGVTSSTGANCRTNSFKDGILDSNTRYYFTLYKTDVYENLGENAYFILSSFGSAYYIRLVDSSGAVLFSRTATKGEPSSYISMTGFEAWLSSGKTIKLSRMTPEMDFICSSNNRLWGVSNNMKNKIVDADGNIKVYEGRAICASSLGDPTNFNDYSGLTTDSYAVGVASDGDFTGIVAYSDDVLCFKEEEMFRVAGSYPAQYSLIQYSIPGVLAGSHKSLTVLNQVLYYLSAAGVYSYSGSVPYNISEMLGDDLTAGVGGTDGRMLYMCMTDKKGKRGIYVYDPINRIWLYEDDSNVIDYAISGNSAYFLSDKIYYTGQDITDALEWSATFQPDYGDVVYQSTTPSFGRKRYTGFYLRGQKFGTGTLTVEVSHDFGETWTNLRTRGFNADTEDEMMPINWRLPMPNVREDSVMVRIAGSGDISIRDMQVQFFEGSTEDYGTV